MSVCVDKSFHITMQILWLVIFCINVPASGTLSVLNYDGVTRAYTTKKGGRFSAVLYALGG